MSKILLSFFGLFLVFVCYVMRMICFVTRPFTSEKFQTRLLVFLLALVLLEEYLYATEDERRFFDFCCRGDAYIK